MHFIVSKNGTPTRPVYAARQVPSPSANLVGNLRRYEGETAPNQEQMAALFAVQVREISKLTLRRRLREMGKEATFDAALDANPEARRDWDDAVSIRTDDPMFTTQAPAFKSALGLTDAQFSALIA